MNVRGQLRQVFRTNIESGLGIVPSSIENVEFGSCNAGFCLMILGSVLMILGSCLMKMNEC